MNDTIANLYVFGSCLRVDTPHDIDLLWIYDETRFNTQQALEFISHKTAHLQLLSTIPIHNTILSHKEETGVRFISASNAQHLCSLSTTYVDSDNYSIAKIDVLRKRKGLTAISNMANESPNET